MENYINDEQRKLIHSLLDKVIDMNNLGNDSFLRFSGHVHGLDVQVFDGIWTEDKEAEIDIITGLHTYDVEKLHKVNREIEELIDKATSKEVESE